MRTTIFVACMLATLAMLANAASSKAPTPSPSADCSTIIYDMVDCVPYLSVGSTDKKPVASCCSGYETVVSTDTECVCVALKTSADMGIEVNFTRAVGLPSTCKLSSPPVDCGIPPAPGAAPANPPSSAPQPAPPADTPPQPSPAPAPPTDTPPQPSPAPPTDAPSQPSPAPPTESPPQPSPMPPSDQSPAPAPSTNNGGGGGSSGITQVPASAPSKAGAYSISASFSVAISLVFGLLAFILA